MNKKKVYIQNIDIHNQSHQPSQNCQYGVAVDVHENEATICNKPYVVVHSLRSESTPFITSFGHKISASVCMCIPW